MSLFKTKGIILKISKLKEKDFIFDIFTYDYGKIKVKKKDGKREKTLDIGYIINFEIETKENKDISKATNIKIKSEFKYENKEFEIINQYLILIGLVYKNLLSGIEFKEIFNIFEEINKKENLDRTKLVLSRLKVINCIGELKIENEDKIVEKILKFINNNKIESILKLKGINNDILSKLEDILI